MKKKINRTISKNTAQDAFNNITKNAIDYLRNSIDEFESKPKYSLINFITSLELFTKARLLKEHWTLVIDNIDKSTFDNFFHGELLTINFKKANCRLTNILQQPLTIREFDCFEKLRKHRNKLIHFFNKEYSGKSSKVKSTVLYELSEGWFYLHNLITQKWKEEFKDYLNEIEIINRKILKNKNFWKGKYNALKDDIKNMNKNGIIFQECFICNFKASKLIEIRTPLYSGECLICNNKTNCLKIECPNSVCHTTIYINESPANCSFCKTPITIDYVKEKYEPFRSPREMASYDYDIHCTECLNFEPTVIEFNDEYLCIGCLTLFDANDLTVCDWCNTQYAGGIGEDTFWLGCELCEGSAGWHGDKD